MIELLGDSVVPGETYALTEVVQRNSKSEAEGAAREALKECMPRYFDAILAVSAARVVVAVGEVAAEAFRLRGFDPAQTVAGPVELAARERLIVFMPHPNKRGGSKSLAGRVPEQVDRLRAALRDTTPLVKESR